MALTRQNFEPGRFSVKGCFGGSALRSNPKTARPFSSKHKIQVVIRLNAQSLLSLRSLKRVGHSAIKNLAFRQAQLFGAEGLDVYQSRNDLFIVAKWKSRLDFSNFLRALGGLLARYILSAERSTPSKEVCFVFRPFSRILEGTRDAWNQLRQRNTLSILCQELKELEMGGPPLWKMLRDSKISVWEFS